MPFRRLLASTTLLGLAWLTGTEAFASPGKEGSSATSQPTYKQAKSELPDNLYTPYRLLDRILGANPEINQPASLGLRSIDSRSCQNLVGEAEICAIASELPDISKSDDFKLWSLQTAGALNSNPNAYANSYTNKIILNRSLADTLAQDYEGQACVIGHEMAHIQQDHTQRYVESVTSLNDTAAKKIRSAIANAHKAMTSNLIITQAFIGLNSSISEYNYNTGRTTSTETADKAKAKAEAEIAAEFAEGRTLLNRILDASQDKTSSVISALRQMEGLAAYYVKRTMQDINIYFAEVNQQAMAISRQQEIEADRLAVGYLARAGINPQGCLRVVAKLSHGKYIQPLREEGSHPSHNRRLEQIQEAITAHAAILQRAQSQIIKPAALAYRYDSQLQLVTVYPRIRNQGRGSSSNATTVDSFLK